MSDRKVLAVDSTNIRKGERMGPLSSNDVESELSYAYLHAVASRAAISCHVAGRHEDNNGVDARLRAHVRSAAPGDLMEVDFDVQLKATIAQPKESGGAYKYSLRGARRYNDLREAGLTTPRILIVLFLPKDAQEWLTHTPEQLVLRRCAYWVSLRGAPGITTDSVIVKLPKTQVVSPDTLTQLAARLSRRDIPTYGAV